MGCQCGPSESCPSCECSIKLRTPKCKVNQDCVISVADDVSISYVGSKKLYIIRLMIKNCTEEVLSNFEISLDLKCALVDYQTVAACDASGQPAGDCVGIQTLSQANPCALLQDLCIQTSPYRANPFYDGAWSINLIDQSRHCNNRLPPGETCFTVRFFTSATASLISPCVTISLTGPCCKPLRKVVMLKADCAPSILDKQCACFLECEP
jgi:hypothetical protein